MIAISFLFLSVCYGYSKPPSDPFLQEWHFFDGVNTYKLNITLSTAPGHDYHIAYTYPNGESATDMCKATSHASFQCQTGETVTRDDSQHSVKLNHRGTLYVFYDPKHMPTTPSIFGKWHFQYKYGVNSVTDYTITLVKGMTDSEYKVNAISRSNNGGICSNDFYDSYQVAYNPDGTQTVSNGAGYWKNQFKLDPNKMQITSDKADHSLKVGWCIEINAEMAKIAQPIFTKQ